MNFDIKTKLITSFSVALFCAIVLGLFSIQRLDGVNAAARTVLVVWLPATRSLGEFSYITMRVRQLEATLLLASESDKKAEETSISARIGESDKAFSAYLAALYSAKDREEALKLRQQWDAYLRIDKTLLTLSKAGDGSAATALYRGEARRVFNAFQGELASNISTAVGAATAAAGESEHLGQSARLLILVALLVTSMICLGSGVSLVRSVSKPLAMITAAALRIAAKEFSIKIPGLERSDEIGSMAKAVQVFKENGLAIGRMEAEAEERRRVAEATRQQVQAEREMLAARQAAVVEGLAKGLEHLAKGNLNFELDAAFAPEYERLRVDFNAAVCGLRETVMAIAVHGQAIDSGTNEIALAADDLARRTEQQAASLEQTAAALDQITTAVQQTAAGSANMRAVVATAAAESEQSGNVVRDAVQAMEEIDASARQIGQIIGVIDEIAFQTNLLALNAGVEAARAGESGRGFAVVASEVRALAQRAADAAKQIKALVVTSMQHVDRGVRLVSETGEALGRIQASVSAINTSISNIATSSKEQSARLAEVNRAVNQMDQVTQQNAAMVEQSTAATRSLSQETMELTNAVGRFSVEPQAGAPLRKLARAG